MRRIIIDTDIGYDVDDAFAVALAALSPEVSLEAITTVHGEVVARGKIAKKILRLCGKDNVEVAAGICRPLLLATDEWQTGCSGKALLDLKDQSIELSNNHAVDVIIQRVLDAPGEITLVAIAPLTNIAVAFMREPLVASSLRELVIMGGVGRFSSWGLSLPLLENNIRFDPEAAAIVFRSNAPITLVPLDVTMQVVLTEDKLELLRKRGTPLTDTLTTLTEIWWQQIGRNESHMHDPLALATVIDSSFVAAEPMNVAIETKGEYTTGMTIFNRMKPHNAKVCHTVDASRFMNFLIHRILEEKV